MYTVKHTTRVQHKGKLTLGDALAGSESLNLNPLLLAGWAALLVNALNSIPVGMVNDVGNDAVNNDARQCGE